MNNHTIPDKIIRLIIALPLAWRFGFDTERFDEMCARTYAFVLGKAVVDVDEPDDE